MICKRMRAAADIGVEERLVLSIKSIRGEAVHIWDLAHSQLIKGGAGDGAAKPWGAATVGTVRGCH